MPINLQTLKNAYIPTETPPTQGSPVSIPNQTGVNQTGTNTFVRNFTDQADITVTPTGGFGNNNYSTASVDNRVLVRAKEPIKSTNANLVAYTFSPGPGIFGNSLIVFSTTFLLPNATFEIRTRKPSWFYNNAIRPKFGVRVIRSTDPTFASYITLDKEYTCSLEPNFGNQGIDGDLIFVDSTIKTAGTYYYSIGMYAVNTFSGDLFCSDTVVWYETNYNNPTTNLA